MEMPVWRFLHTGAHAHGAGANAYRVYVRGVRGLTLASSGGTTGSTPIPCALSGASNVEQRLEQMLQLHQFLLTRRVTHKVLRTYFPLESKQARAQRNLSSQKPRQGD